MNTSITLDNGFIYQSWWGGDLVDPSRFNFSPDDIGIHCRIRRYHHLEKITVNGTDWVKEYQIDPHYPSDRFAHHDYYSVDGLFHVAVYHGEYDRPYYPLFGASTPRKNMQSTFGNYVNGHKDPFKSFKLAASFAALNKTGE